MPERYSTKSCSKCGEEKYLGEFHVRKAATCGRASRCKSCTVADKVEYRQNQVTSDSEYGARYRKETPEKNSTRKKLWRENNPEKRRAHAAVALALRTETLTKPKICSRCGISGRIEGHHPDYTQPLSVIWLCPQCHIRLHSGVKNYI